MELINQDSMDNQWVIKGGIYDSCMYETVHVQKQRNEVARVVTGLYMKFIHYLSGRAWSGPKIRSIHEPETIP